MLKNLLILTLMIPLLFSCGTAERKQEAQDPKSALEKIAYAHGFEHFAKVEFLQYSFNVQRDTTISSRTWNWYPKTAQVTYIMDTDSTRYSLTDVTGELSKIDHRFINDKYWLLFPFQLIWDENITSTNYGATQAPISGASLTKITIQYGAEGGYTPGDAYDIYVDKDWIIREWAFRKSGSEEASLVTTWQDYQDYNGLKIATNHLNESGNFRLFFTNLEIK